MITTSALAIRENSSLRRAPCSVSTFQLRRELADLPLPVADDADGSHDQARLAQAPLLLFQREMGERLHRFAQPHVVGEDAAGAGSAAETAATPGLLADRRRSVVWKPGGADSR